MIDDDVESDIINMEMFLGYECKYCKNPHCDNPRCILKKIHGYAKEGLTYGDQDSLSFALESIENLTEFLIDRD